MRLCSPLSLFALLLCIAPALAEPLFSEANPRPPAPPLAARADSMWLFAPSGFGAYGEPGTNERGYTFDGFGECMRADWQGYGSTTVELRENNFLPGENETCVWTFFDPALGNAEYPMGIIPYGPPYLEMWIESPPLEVDAAGNPLNMAWGEGSVLLRFDVYRDLPLDPLVFYFYQVSGRGPEGDYWGFLYYGYVFYGEDGWITEEIDISLELEELLGQHVDTLAGVKVRLGVVDLCDLWCDTLGSGENHTLGPLFDNVRVCVVTEPTGAPTETAPRASALQPLQPNPFNPKTTLRFTLAEAGFTELSVMDLSGRRLRHLAAGFRAAGDHRLDWDGRDDAGRELPAGIYLVRLETESERFSRKAVLLK